MSLARKKADAEQQVGCTGDVETQFGDKRSAREWGPAELASERESETKGERPTKINPFVVDQAASQPAMNHLATHCSQLVGAREANNGAN